MGEFKTILIDGNNIARAMFEAHKDLSFRAENHRVYETGTVFGVLDILSRFRRKYGGDKVFITWDKGYDHRLRIDSQYKANRRGNIWEERGRYDAQVDLLKKVLRFTPFMEVSAQGYEADDVICTMSHNVPSPVLIVSADKDLLQLLTPEVCVLKRNPHRRREVLLTDKDFERKFEFTPDKWIWFQSLMGDSADNIKGIKGIGKERAAVIIRDFCSVYEDWIINGDENAVKESGLPTGVKTALLNGREDALKALRLVALSADAPIKIRRNRFDEDRLIDSLEMIGCFSLTEPDTFAYLE